ncbi:MAG: hypothetical protein BMS9Abin17_1457 [Acidimicrobiia bacterium]|nr:MAG: hypothetical protein BMS9Abin17_1457 [Acidimicrobiia bacterium]
MGLPALPRTRFFISAHRALLIAMYAGSEMASTVVIVHVFPLFDRRLSQFRPIDVSYGSELQVLHISTAIHRWLCTTYCVKVLRGMFSRAPGSVQPTRYQAVIPSYSSSILVAVLSHENRWLYERLPWLKRSANEAWSSIAVAADANARGS